MPSLRPSRAARWLCLPALALGLAALPACDTAPSLDGFEIILNLDDVPISLGAGVTAAVTPDRPTAASATVPSDFDVASIDALESISLRPDMFSFQPAVSPPSSSRRSSAPSGTIAGYVFVGGVPVPGTPVTLTVADGVVTEVSPAVISTASSTLDRAAIEAFLADLPGAERPDLADWPSLTLDQIRDRIRQALAGSEIPVSVGLEVTATSPDDPLTGSITLDEIDVSAIISR